VSKEIELSERMELVNTIAENYLLKGVNNPTKIAKELGIPRKDVLEYIDEWRKIAQNSEGVKDRAAELLTEMDRGYDQIINELWIAHASAESAKDAAGILKTIADVIAKRQEVLQKAGLYDDANLGDELAIAEEQMDKIKELLKQIATNHPQTRQEIMYGLGVIFKRSESLPVKGELA
jgi:hypothetical protein